MTTREPWSDVADPLQDTASPMDGADAVSPDAPTEPEFPTFPLSADPRLQFWRETYLAALPPLISVLAPGAVDHAQLAAVAVAARGIADLALAHHMARNDRPRLDRLIFDLLLVAAPNLDGPK